MVRLSPIDRYARFLDGHSVLKPSRLVHRTRTTRHSVHTVEGEHRLDWLPESSLSWLYHSLSTVERLSHRFASLRIASLRFDRHLPGPTTLSGSSGHLFVGNGGDGINCFD